MSHNISHYLDFDPVLDLVHNLVLDSSEIYNVIPE